MVCCGEEQRVRLVAPRGNGQTRLVTVTLFVGPTTLWTSASWNVSRWTYSASGLFCGACSAPCGGESQSPISWMCNRSDGTGGHSQGNCSGAGSVLGNTNSCPFSVRTHGQMRTIRDPLTNADRYNMTCRKGGNGPNIDPGPSTDTVMPPIWVSADISSKEFTARIGNPGGDEGGYPMPFSGTSSLSVIAFNPRAEGRHPYMCKVGSTSTSAGSNQGDIDPQNCSLYVFCYVHDRNSGAYIYPSTTGGNRSINGGSTSNQSVVNLPVNGW